MAEQVTTEELIIEAKAEKKSIDDGILVARNKVWQLLTILISIFAFFSVKLIYDKDFNIFIFYLYALLSIFTVYILWATWESIMPSPLDTDGFSGIRDIEKDDILFFYEQACINNGWILNRIVDGFKKSIYAILVYLFITILFISYRLITEF